MGKPIFEQITPEFMSEPKKETVRIVLPPRREGQSAAGNPRENAMINLPPKPAPAPTGGAPLPPAGLKPPSPPVGLTPPKPPSAPLAPAGLKPPMAPASPAVAAPKPAAMLAPAPIAVKPEAKKETAKVTPSPSKPMPQATVQLTPKAPLPSAAATSSFKTSDVAPVAEAPDSMTTILGAAAVVAALIALGVQFL